MTLHLERSWIKSSWSNNPIVSKNRLEIETSPIILAVFLRSCYSERWNVLLRRLELLLGRLNLLRLIIKDKKKELLLLIQRLESLFKSLQLLFVTLGSYKSLSLCSEVCLSEVSLFAGHI